MYVHIRRGKKYKNMPKTKNGNKKYNKKKKNGMATMICTYASEISARLST